MEKNVIGLAFTWLLLMAACFAGWVTNIIELLQRHATMWDIAIGIVGIFAAPIGILRGFGHWFGLC